MSMSRNVARYSPQVIIASRRCIHVLEPSLFVPLAFVVVAAVAGTGVAADSADATLENFYHQYLEEVLHLRPLDATRLGDRRFDHLLDDLFVRRPPALARARSTHARATARCGPR